MHPAFKIYEEATPELIKFLEGTTLGTNGARYQHLDIAIRIKELDNPLHLSLIRNKKIIANITFCRRGKDWYIRYFAFDRIFQSSSTKSESKGQSTFKKELIHFFREKIESGEVDCFYAYIDPNNKRSFEFAKELGFLKKDTIHTQTFSRLSPKMTKKVRELEINDTLLRDKLKNFENESFFHNVKNSDAFYGLFNENNSLQSIASINRLNWKIIRLPGIFGGIMNRVVPYIPFIRKIIAPKNHRFIGIDHVWTSQNAGQLTELFENILARENKTLAIWWSDSRLDSYKNVKWGLAHKFLGVNPVDLYVMNDTPKNYNQPYFLISKDFS